MNEVLRAARHPVLLRAIGKGGGACLGLWLTIAAYTHEQGEGVPVPLRVVEASLYVGHKRERNRALRALIEVGAITETEDGYVLSTGLLPGDFDPSAPVPPYTPPRRPTQPPDPRQTALPFDPPAAPPEAAEAPAATAPDPPPQSDPPPLELEPDVESDDDDDFSFDDDLADAAPPAPPLPPPSPARVDALNRAMEEYERSRGWRDASGALVTPPPAPVAAPVAAPIAAPVALSEVGKGLFPKDQSSTPLRVVPPPPSPERLAEAREAVLEKRGHKFGIPRWWMALAWASLEDHHRRSFELRGLSPRLAGTGTPNRAWAMFWERHATASAGQALRCVDLFVDLAHNFTSFTKEDDCRKALDYAAGVAAERRREGGRDERRAG